MCSQTDVREIKQLWYAAGLYYSLLPKDVDRNEMDKIVGQWSNECEISDGLKMVSDKFYRFLIERKNNSSDEPQALPRCANLSENSILSEDMLCF
jgi:hypothetical protein